MVIGYRVIRDRVIGYRVIGYKFSKNFLYPMTQWYSIDYETKKI